MLCVRITRMTSTNIVIIGAGAAGLAAAKELQERGQDFLLLDASHRIGGRAYTEELAPGVPFDLGAHWVMAPSDNPLMPYAKSGEIELDAAGEHYTAARYFEERDWLPDNAYEEFGEYWNRQFAALAEATSSGEDSPVFDIIDNDSRWAPYFHMFFAQDFTRDVDQASAKDTLNYIRKEDDLAVTIGLGNLLARYGANVPVSLNSAVRKIDSSGVDIKLETTKGQIRANKVILTVSTGVLASRQIDIAPALPEWKLAAIGGLPLGSCTRVGLMFDDPILRDLPSEFTVDTSGDGPIHFRNRPFGHDYVEIATGGRMAEWMEKSGDSATIAFILEKMRSMAGQRSVPNPSHSIVSAWDGDAWVKGAYSCAQPGAADLRSVLARPVDDRIFFAGEATSSGYYASVHGACISGTEAARAACD
jgi:monoamine oxidase